MTKVIAEIGWNHCGDIELAKKFIISASKCGADYAKFQTWSTSRLKPGVWDDDGRREIYNKAELSREDHLILMDCCNKNNINFLSSVFSIMDAKLLSELGCAEVKIPSFESRNLELIKYCNKHFKTIFLSTGTSSLDEIKESISLINTASLYLMHCVSVYPQQYSESNLPRMKRLMKITKN